MCLNMNVPHKQGVLIVKLLCQQRHNISHTRTKGENYNKSWNKSQYWLKSKLASIKMELYFPYLMIDSIKSHKILA